MNHTPTPWTAKGYDVRAGQAGRMIAYTGPHHTPDDQYPKGCKLEDEANAAFIVKAVNCHDELVEALENCLSAFETHYVAGEKLSDIYSARIERARAAIAKAKGE
jgi:hypothetical protein